MSKWKEIELGKLAEIQTGPFGSQLHQKDYVPYGTPLITVKNLGENRVTYNKLDFVSDQDKERLSKFILEEGDIVFSRVGYVDRRAYITKKECGWMFSGSTLRVRVKIISALNPKYLSYYFGYKKVKDDIKNLSVGATRPSLNTQLLEELEIIIPPLPEQRAIASVLSSLDNKIDLLHRQNQTLEAMAETLFRQWFVEGAKEGWKSQPLGNLVTVKRGGSPRPIQEYLSDTGYRWLKISDATKENSPYIFEIKEHIKEDGLSKTTLLKSGSLVLSNSATPGIPKILQVATCIHDGWLHFPKSYFSNEFLYLLFKIIRPELLMQGNGSIFTNLKTDIIKEYKIPIPDINELNKFQNSITLIFEKLLINSIQIRTLTRLRDTLLPKLMSGEVRVQIAQGEAAI